MKNAYFLVLLVCDFIFLNAQPEIDWQKCLGGSGIDYPNTIIQTIDGGYIFSGTTTSVDGDVTGNNGDRDTWVVKLSTSGDIEWQKCLGGSQSDNPLGVGRSGLLIQTNDNGYLVVGATQSNDGDVSGNHGARDGWVVKLSTSGNIEWQKCLGGSSSEDISSVIQTSNGDYVLVGGTNSNDGDVSGLNGTNDAWILKLSPNGTILWQNCLGGSAGDGASSVIETQSGGYFVSGWSHSNDGDVLENKGSSDGWVVKLSNNGTIEWQKTFGGSGTDRLNAAKQTSNGNYITIGYSNSNNGDVLGNHGSYDIWALELTDSGAIVWQKCFGGSSWDYGYSIIQITDGSYVLTSTVNSDDGDITGHHGNSGNNSGNDVWAANLSTNGDIVWQKCLGGSNSDWAYSVSETPDGGLILANDTGSNDGDVSGNQGGADAWIVKLNSVLSTNELSNIIPSIRVFPNPTTSKWTIESSRVINTLTLFNLLGQKVLEQTANNTKVSIDASNLKTGVYMLQINNTIMKRMIKR